MMMMMFMNWECFFLLRYDMIQGGEKVGFIENTARRHRWGG